MESIKNLFGREVFIDGNLIKLNTIIELKKNQNQTKGVFTDKWEMVEKESNKKNLFDFQEKWFLTLYGFESENKFRKYLKDKTIILDAGCGLGYKAAWFAELAPHAIVIGIDISEALVIASKNYKHLSNLYFHQGDIARTGIKENSIDFTVCDQVIMHTENPEKTFEHLTAITKKDGEFACYVYRKKALPRELLDDHFRKATFDIPNDKLWEMSSQLTELGKRLSKLDVKFESPDIPALGIKGGTYDIQRFIYWNFIKCFWRDDWDKEICKSVNFDWYAPSNAKRYTKDDFLNLIEENRLSINHFHEEEACFSTRLLKE